MIVEEIEALRLIATRNANKEIAARLSIQKTVKSRMKSSLDELGATTERTL